MSCPETSATTTYRRTTSPEQLLSIPANAAATVRLPDALLIKVKSKSARLRQRHEHDICLAMTTAHSLELWSGSYFAWRDRVKPSYRALMAFAWAALTGLTAQIAIPLPGTPVPLTGQTLAVLLAGVFLGRNWGALSQGIYVSLGALGLPWFAGQTAGAGALLGATGGYLFGFVLAALFLGYAVNGKPERRGFFALTGLMWFASFVLIQLPGLAGLALWHHTVTGSIPSLDKLLAMGMVPFVPGDVLKILVAATIARAVSK